jgi:hypothetical protein
MSRTSGALLLSPAQANVTDAERRTLAVDDQQKRHSAEPVASGA